jgi:hypothetical protein
MKYKTISSERIKRTTYKLLLDEQMNYIVAKIVGIKVIFLYSSKKSELSIKYYERTVGA